MCKLLLLTTPINSSKMTKIKKLYICMVFTLATLNGTGILNNFKFFDLYPVPFLIKLFFLI